MKSSQSFFQSERDACGVGFTVSRQGQPSHEIVQDTLKALSCEEHRGACGSDPESSDGAGILIDIPFEFFGYEPKQVAVAHIFAPQQEDLARIAFTVFEDTFRFFGLQVLSYREVPHHAAVLGVQARESLPRLRMAFVERPAFIHSDDAFSALLYQARQMTRTKNRDAGIHKQFFFASLSPTTVVYKALSVGERLSQFYPDLQDPRVRSRFGMFHRRFSTNTRTSWDKAQPFRLIAHNGEINTISGNRAWAYSREQALGLPVDELLTHEGISDSGNLNEMVEALRYRSSIPYLGDVLSILIPSAELPADLHVLWSRAMEPWDGPAFVTYCDEEHIGARLDRNGFRPCRWTMTAERFYLASEAGSFRVHPEAVLGRGTLVAGSGLSVHLASGEVDLKDASRSIARQGVQVDPRLHRLQRDVARQFDSTAQALATFGYVEEDLSMLLLPMAAEGKEAIGSMGNTARLAVFSEEPRPLYDYFFQHFAQVTNPPVDYIREKAVTDLSMYLGRTPNVFAPKELIPPFEGLRLESPVLRPEELAGIRRFLEVPPFRSRLAAAELHCSFARSGGADALAESLSDLTTRAVDAVRSGHTLLILSDESADFENPPIPMLLAVAAVVHALDEQGLRLRSSIVVATAEVRSAHQLACLVSFGASAVCPSLSFAVVEQSDHKTLRELSPERRRENLFQAFTQGLLRIMAKVGISVARSYHGSRLFTCVGLGPEVTNPFFPGVRSPIAGLSFEQLSNRLLAQCRAEALPLPNTYQFKEQSKGKSGEQHSMTVLQARLIHRLVRESKNEAEQDGTFREYQELTESQYPINIRHTWKLLASGSPTPLQEVESVEEITKRFGAGAMSFGAISAESQRDIIQAMRTLGGRSNSGEGGENPYYWIDGTTASVKQVASARFGVTGQYLISAEEIQIKIAQGAKPGEGGQLMREKVDEHIARARHASSGIDLISPPPLHDIYSIEDLKELIYELKQFNPNARVGVKLVAGSTIGTIAAGVAKAGADCIHISGGDGGTGAAALTSMKHAGLPWELGLAEVHHALVAHDLRRFVELRVDGGLSTASDILVAATLGAEGFDFGKLLLVAEGCIMARICQSNTCPVGIATHAERFKAKYKGEAAHIIALLKTLARDVRRQLSALGLRSLEQAIGRSDLVKIDERFRGRLEETGLEFSELLREPSPRSFSGSALLRTEYSSLNAKIIESVGTDLASGRKLQFSISPEDRAVPAGLNGRIAAQRHAHHLRTLGTEKEAAEVPVDLELQFTGSAGQGFGMLLEAGLRLMLHGEANDSVCKSMSGGEVVIRDLQSDPENEHRSLVGNCALYGATGGALYVAGSAGDRFAVRNSGALSVVEGLGLHGCEYMTSGRVIVLGSIGANFGAGMTGGDALLLDVNRDCIHQGYLQESPLSDSLALQLHAHLEAHLRLTESRSAAILLEDWSKSISRFSLFVPLSAAGGI